MQRIYNFQASIDRIPLDEIDVDPTSRDDAVPYLAGFLAILLDVETRAALIVLLEKYFMSDKSRKRGRPGMDLLVIVLLAGLKHATDMDYDRLTTWANQMGVLRQIMEPRISSGIVVSVFMIMCQNVL